MVIPVEDESTGFVPSVAYIPQEEVSIGLVECIVGTKQGLAKAYSFFIAGLGVIKIGTKIDWWVDGSS